MIVRIGNASNTRNTFSNDIDGEYLKVGLLLARSQVTYENTIANLCLYSAIV